MRLCPRPGPRGAPTEGRRQGPRRVAVGLGLALAGAASCNLSTPGPPPLVVLRPVLDSMYVGDRLSARSVTYYDASGVPQTPAASQVTWSSSDSTILGVGTSGQLTGRKRGLAFVLATVQGATGAGLVVVSNTLDLTLLLDTVYAMPGDTLTIPVAVRKSSAPPPVVWFRAPVNAVYTVDSATGRLTATGLGGPIPYIVHADTIADTGAVTVLTLSDTIGGQFFYSVVGTVISHAGGSIRAANYRRSDGIRAFQLRGTNQPNDTALRTVEIILPDSVTAPGPFVIDSLGFTEAASGLAPFCLPPRAWALWTSQAPSILSYSRRGGMLAVTQVVAVPSGNGQAVSGHFRYTTQRADLAGDPLGVLTVQGSFVAPLVLTDLTVCR